MVPYEFSHGDLPLLIYGDHRQLALRHELPLTLSRPALYLEADGTRTVLADSTDAPRIAGSGHVDKVLVLQELGLDEQMRARGSWRAAVACIARRVCDELSISDAVIPPETEAFMVDALRGQGLSLDFDERLFALRRRKRSSEEMAGIERAQRAAEDAMGAVKNALNDGYTHTSEELRRTVTEILAGRGASPEKGVIVASGAESADPLQAGSGPIRGNAPIIVDIYPRDLETGCWGDLTRTFCLGDPPPELVTWHRDLLETQRLVMDAVRPGATGDELNRLGSDFLEARGYTSRCGSRYDSRQRAGSLHMLGHGVGLDLIEPPLLDIAGEELMAGDVITIEPAVYQAGLGGCRIEDLVLVTESGCRNLTECPYGYAVAGGED